MNQVLGGTKTRKLAVQTVAGAAVGALAMYLFLEIGDGFANFKDPSRLIAAAAGVVYSLMGIFVGIGALVPGAGAKYLNVEDAREIMEERSKIGPGAVVCILVGAMLLALALTPSGEFPGVLSRDTTAWLAAGAFAGLIAVSLWMRGRMDELNRSLGMEGSSLAMQVSVVLFGGWAALAHLGYVEWVAPLGLLAGFAIVELAAIFWVVGKRGMLMPR